MTTAAAPPPASLEHRPADHAVDPSAAPSAAETQALTEDPPGIEYELAGAWWRWRSQVGPTT